MSRWIICAGRQGVSLEALPETNAADVVTGGGEEQTPDEIVNLTQEQGLLARVIASLPEKCRQVLILRKIHGLSQKEIALRLGIAEHTVEKHISHGVRLCAERVLGASNGAQPEADAIDSGARTSAWHRLKTSRVAPRIGWRASTGRGVRVGATRTSKMVSGRPAAFGGVSALLGVWNRLDALKEPAACQRGRNGKEAVEPPGLARANPAARIHCDTLAG